MYHHRIYRWQTALYANEYMTLVLKFRNTIGNILKIQRKHYSVTERKL